MSESDFCPILWFSAFLAFLIGVFAAARSLARLALSALGDNPCELATNDLSGDVLILGMITR